MNQGRLLGKIAADFGIHQITLSPWLKKADIDDGAKPGITSTGFAELREANKRIPLLGGAGGGSVEGCPGVCVARVNFRKRNYPLESEHAVDGIPLTVSCRVLKIARAPNCRWLREPAGPAGHCDNNVFAPSIRLIRMIPCLVIDSWLTKPTKWAFRWRIGLPGVYAISPASWPRLCKPRNDGGRNSDRLSVTTLSGATSTRRDPTGCGWWIL